MLCFLFPHHNITWPHVLMFDYGFRSIYFYSEPQTAFLQFIVNGSLPTIVCNLRVLVIPVISTKSVEYTCTQPS